MTNRIPDPVHLHPPLMLDLWTGQRQGDLLALTWPQYDGKRIRLKQGKTGARVVTPVGAAPKAYLDPLWKKVRKVLLNSDGDGTPDGFRSSWGTAVTRLALAEYTEAEIATITGHSLRNVRSILDAYYLSRDPQLADNAIRKLETRKKSPN
jgi:integrase